MFKPSKRAFSITVAGAAMLWSPTLHAEDRGVVYAGGSAGDGYNVYGGGVVSLPGASLGNGFALRGGVSGGRYEYDNATAQIEGNYISGEVALVYQTSGDWGWANFSAGPRITNTDLQPGDPQNKRAGTRVDLALQSDGAVGKRWRLDWFGSVGVVDQVYLAELRFGPFLDQQSGTRLGVEGGIQGDDTYTRRMLGGFVGTRFADKWEGRISGGVGKLEGRSSNAYATLSVSHVF